METWDVIVVGGGISGLAFADRAAREGKRTLVLEATGQLGGCLRTAREPSGFWLELGAHTAYNSYGGFLDIIEAAGAVDELLPRTRQPFKLLRGGRIESVGAALGKGRIALGALTLPFRSKHGRTVAAYYGGIVGAKNYAGVVSRLLSAVPSQRVDDFPADMLFKKRPRRKDRPRSFTLRTGLQRVAELVAARPEVTARCGQPVARIDRDADGAFTVHTADGATHTAPTLAVAVPPSAAAELLRDAAPDIAESLAKIEVRALVSVGVVVPAEAVAHLEPVAGIVPAADDVFWSVVSRDVVPDERLRGFTFHFAPDVDEARRDARIAEVLGVPADAWTARHEARAVLPSPRLGHHELVAAIDRALKGDRLAVTGNYFAGLAIEDCVARSHAEYARVA